LRDSFAYLAATFTGLRVVNIARPDSMFEVGCYDTPGSSQNVEVSGAYAFVADASSGGLRVINVANPRVTYEEGYYLTPGSAMDLSSRDGLVYLASSNGGLQLVEFLAFVGTAEDVRPETRRAAQPATIVRGTIGLAPTPGSSRRDARLLDISGRTVLDLHPGANSVAGLAPGIYFIAERSGDSGQQPTTRKVVILH
jgi:hypothetical protein